MLNLDPRLNVSSYEVKNLESQLVLGHKTGVFWLVPFFFHCNTLLFIARAFTAADYTMHIKDVGPNLSYDSNTSLRLRKRGGRYGPFIDLVFFFFPSLWLQSLVLCFVQRAGFSRAEVTTLSGCLILNLETSGSETKSRLMTFCVREPLNLDKLCCFTEASLTC